MLRSIMAAICLAADIWIHSPVATKAAIMTAGIIVYLVVGTMIFAPPPDMEIYP
jgi:hypothetical protein